MLASTLTEAFAEELSRKPPPGYDERIRALLTAVDPLLAKAPLDATKEIGGEIVLYERVIQVEEGA